VVDDRGLYAEETGAALGESEYRSMKRILSPVKTKLNCIVTEGDDLNATTAFRLIGSPNVSFISALRAFLLKVSEESSYADKIEIKGRLRGQVQEVVLIESFGNRLKSPVSPVRNKIDGVVRYIAEATENGWEQAIVVIYYQWA
jgi:hypothetical protein